MDSESELIHKAFLTAGLLPAGEQLPLSDLHFGKVALEINNSPLGLAQRIMDMRNSGLQCRHLKDGPKCSS